MKRAFENIILLLLLSGSPVFVMAVADTATEVMMVKENSFPDSLPEYRLRVPAADFLQKYREDPAFQYVERVEVPNWWQRFKMWLAKHLRFKSSSGKIKGLDIFLECLGFLLLGFLIYKLVKSKYFFGFQEKKTKDLNLEFTAERVDEVRYPQLVEQALLKKDYALAIRVNYWYILHLMDTGGLIHWEAYKTNRSYWHEIKDVEYRDDFGKLSRIFESVCYGDFDVDEVMYRNLEQEFVAFQQKLGR